MVPDLSKINGVEDYTTKSEKERTLFYKQEKVFLVVNKNTIEVRCDDKLSQVLQEEYESVMQSRYFGKGGIEIVLSNQLSPQELEDLIRLSYDLTI
ncbi:MmcQ/YjbR family DNA-binding protein [Candidatus Saccharibacteria bacterium]|nr:MmcQ/YjbR family DNA-binding protein [Candidatus Saccharibacteria bacterium]